MDALIDILAGTAGGIAQVVIGHPLDTLKVRLQTQPYKNGKPQYFDGMLDCVVKTLKKEGFRGLYKGAASPLAGAMLHNANVFFCFGRMKQLIAGGTSRELTILETTIAGAIGGIGMALTNAPIDLFKCKLQAQFGTGLYKGTWDCATDIFKKHGIRGVFQGYGATVIRNVPCFGLYFFGYEFTKRLISVPEPAPIYVVAFAGGVAGLCYWAIFYPLEVIKTRIQCEPTEYNLRRYKSTLGCLRQMYLEEGFSSLWRGYVPCTLRAITCNAGIFAGVVYTERLLLT
eukprot:TRINITY_DN6174_c0_g1_i1.p1 TRINITY_DN6174_c0_g1~~TRINITY_DN6174_c0_g1_i1.p1  ORF type:complete len:286 (-),score=44.41 TRINITY_DN6174_c0_g1_i1:30-887(-)